MNKLKSKVAIVTGASKGIGASIAKCFANEGASVVVNYALSRDGADKVVKAIQDSEGNAVPLQGDVSQPGVVAQLFEETKKVFGRVDILVNNAGIYIYEPVENISEETFRKSFDVNVWGSLLTIQEAVKQFGENGGNIINISSKVSTIPLPGGAVYSATKAALDAITVALSKEFAGRNIRINSILPGVVATEGAENAGFIGSEAEKHLISKTPLGRTGRPEDIAKVALFLASDDSGFITGEKIAVSGGIYGL